jgi:uncharacterized membrane protein YeaQ/YmgE (transglycosylase-associated protein family)
MVPHLALAWMTSGAAAGMVAGTFLRRWEHGPAGDILAGIIGSLVSGFVAGHVHLRIGSYTTTALILGFLGGSCSVALTRTAAWQRIGL